MSVGAACVKPPTGSRGSWRQCACVSSHLFDLPLSLSRRSFGRRRGKVKIPAWQRVGPVGLRSRVRAPCVRRHVLLPPPASAPKCAVKLPRDSRWMARLGCADSLLASAPSGRFLCYAKSAPTDDNDCLAFVRRPYSVCVWRAGKPRTRVWCCRRCCKSSAALTLLFCFCVSGGVSCTVVGSGFFFFFLFFSLVRQDVVASVVVFVCAFYANQLRGEEREGRGERAP